MARTQSEERSVEPVVEVPGEAYISPFADFLVVLACTLGTLAAFAVVF